MEKGQASARDLSIHRTPPATAMIHSCLPTRSKLRATYDAEQKEKCAQMRDMHTSIRYVMHRGFTRDDKWPRRVGFLSRVKII